MNPDYRIRMLEYAVIPEQTTEAAYTGYAYPGETRRFPFSLVLVESPEHTVLVDCGINFASETKRRMADGFGLENCQSPDAVLASVGLSTEDIDTIIPTHAHWDHMGSIEMFPNATVYLQRRELEGWRRLLEGPDSFAALTSAMDPDDIAAIDQVDREGRLVLLDGDVEDLLPGIHIWVEIDGHTHASQMVLIESGIVVGPEGSTDNHIVVGDVAYTLDNLTGVPQFPHFIPNTKWSIGGPYRAMQSYQRILDYVGDDLHRVVIEHDNESWSRYPTDMYFSDLHSAEIRRPAQIQD
jgi:N-acyl homoserine lactone hydrolase